MKAKKMGKTKKTKKNNKVTRQKDIFFSPNLYGTWVIFDRGGEGEYDLGNIKAPAQNQLRYMKKKAETTNC